MASTKKGVDANATKPSAPQVTDGDGAPKVEATTEEPKAQKMRAKWVGNVATWTVPGWEGEQPSLDIDKVNAELRDKAMRLGFGSKVPDAAAKPKGTPVAEKVAAMLKVIEALYAGDWVSERGESYGDGVLMEAFNEFRISQKKPAQFANVGAFQKWVDEGSASTKTTAKAFIASMEQNPKLKPIVDRLRLAKLKDVKFDSEAFLA